MPESKYGSVDLIGVDPANLVEFESRCDMLLSSATAAMEISMFIEWLESFVAAWNASHDVVEASLAGIIEWDM